MRQKNNEATKRYRSDPQNAKKVACHQIVDNAIKLGILKRQPCEKCGAARVDAHHDDYMRPLDVRWLCRSCHKALHAKLKRHSHSPEPA